LPMMDRGRRLFRPPWLSCLFCSVVGFWAGGGAGWGAAAGPSISLSILIPKRRLRTNLSD
jgi:hypothetical protein